jgi:cytochrome c-type biogenesis protein CcsB
MKRPLIIGILLVAAATMAALLAAGRLGRGAEAAAPSTFLASLDLTPLGHLAVHHDGRLKSFDSHARSVMDFVTGPRKFQGQSPTVTYLDLMLRPEAYERAEVIYIKNKLVRKRIAHTLGHSMQEDLARARSGSADAARLQSLAELEAEFNAQIAAFMKSGLASEPMLMDPQVQQALGQLSQDLLKGTSKDVDRIESALTVKRPQVLRSMLALVPPPPPAGGFDDPWLTIDEVGQAAMDGRDLGLSADVHAGIAQHWAAFESAWTTQDAAGVNSAVTALAPLLTSINPTLYPPPSRLAWENWYFKAKHLTWVWMIYLLAIAVLLMAVVYRWPGARVAGISLFALALGLHTFAVMLRWYVADRWPNSNMFEAVTTAAWFAACAAVVLEVLVRRTPMRNLFFLGSAAAAMVALMCAHFLPVYLNPNISNMMPVLHDVWLYIHTNIIIFSYLLIFIAAILGAMYLLLRLFGGPKDYARVGGAGSLILAGADGQAYLQDGRSSFAQVLDGATMVLMELAFVLLWSGVVMGAIWADHSWGRPWGWDPKEVFALNTFIIFVLLVHTRLKVKDKGLWTAILAVVGCVVMLFNWIIINFTISGLHSYA